MQKRFKELRKERGVESVKSIVATDAMIKKMHGNGTLRTIVFSTDEFHRTKDTPICMTLYPTLPRAIRPWGKGRNRSGLANIKRWRRNEYEAHLAQLASLLDHIVEDFPTLGSIHIGHGDGHGHGHGHGTSEQFSKA